MVIVCFVKRDGVFMVAQENLTEEQKKINEAAQEEEKFYRETLESFFEAPKISPLKSIEAQEKERNQKVNDFINVLKTDVEQGAKYFIEGRSQEELKKLTAIFDKVQTIVDHVAGKSEIQELTDEDCTFLEELAKKSISDLQYEKASCMFRLIIKLNPLFSGAWVGWAVSEQELEHFEVVEIIYEMATQLLPFDCYVILFAAEYYAKCNSIDKAKDVLKRAKELLIENDMKNSNSYEAVEEALKNLQST